MEGHFGIDTIMEAKQFRQQLLDMNDSMYMSNLPKDGHVMAYLSMIIPPKLQIHVEPRILDEFHNISNVYCPEKPIETSLFVEQSNEDNSNSNNTLLLFNNDETTMSMEQVTDIHVHRVLSLLDEAGESGMTMPALMTALSSNATTTTTTTTDIITCNLLDSILRQLIRHHQVMLAGIDTIYYVTRAYTASWCLPVLSSTSSDGQQVSETERVPPRQWYDIYGNMDKEIWLACQRTLLMLFFIVLNRLLQQFSAAFTLVELPPSSVGLFSKSTPYEVSDSVVLHPNAMPCYWANTDGYAQLSNDEP
ncbi:hypothetical protein BDF22DRAFT_745111 [Syncephalis plumigaleata]|nr:hypothetical protein BDF22DRAFT_745111 [Syncephalis plumigaleata]